MRLRMTAIGPPAREYKINGFVKNRWSGAAKIVTAALLTTALALMAGRTQGAEPAKAGAAAAEQFSGQTAAASEAAHSKIKELHRESAKVQERLKASQSQLEDMARKERALVEEMDGAERSLDHSRRQVRAARASLDALEQKMAGIETQYTALEKEIRISEAYAAQRVIALYKLNWVGRVHLLATAPSFFDFVYRKNALEAILSQDDAELEKLRSNQNTLEALLEQLNTGRAEKKSLEAALNQRIADLSAEQARRTALLEKMRKKKELENYALAALQQAAQELDTTLQTLKPAAKESRPPAPVAIMETNQSFEASKGLLSWPVRGKIISFFGPDQDAISHVEIFRSGIDIQTERGEPIRAVSNGYAIFASWLKGFGNMIVIDHGNHYYTVYAHLEEVFKVKGDRIEKGEVIATVGDSGSLTGPALHFEVRHHDKPLDPLMWINKG